MNASETQHWPFVVFKKSTFSFRRYYTTMKKLKIFLCHSSGDKPAVRGLYQRLCGEGVDPWLDEEDLLPGHDWNIEIRKAIKTIDVVVVCLSKGVIDKAGFVHKEIKIALDAADERPEGAIFIIPVKLEECNIPERLSRWHCVNLFEEKGYGRLMKALKHRAGELGLIIPGKTGDMQAESSHLLKDATIDRSTIHSKEPHLQAESGSKPTVKLRSTPVEGLSEGSVKSMLQQYNYYCVETRWSKKFCNPNGSGVLHNYEKQGKDGAGVVIDHAGGLVWQQSGSDEMNYKQAKEYVDQLNCLPHERVGQCYRVSEESLTGQGSCKTQIHTFP